MPYIISNGENHVMQSSKGIEITDILENATKWTKTIKVNNVFNNIQRNKKFKNYHLNVRFIEQEYGNIHSPAIPIELEYDILDRINQIAEFSKQIEGRRQYLIEQIHNVDLELVDIEHAAEFYNLSASQGYKLYKMLHDVRSRRRLYKNELQKINLSIGTAIKSDNMKNLQRSIIGVDNKQYCPRVNKELFGV